MDLQDSHIRIRSVSDVDVEDLASDPRFSQLGLSQKEAKYVVRQCLKYCNIRDTLEDLIQEALLGLCNAFRKTELVRHRISFINSVVRNTMHSKIVRKNKKDMIYRSINLNCSIDDLDREFLCFNEEQEEEYYFDA